MFKKVLITTALTVAITLMTVGGSGYSDSVSVVNSAGEGNIWVVPKSIELPNISVANSAGEGNIWVVPKSIELPNISVANSAGEGNIWVVPKSIEISTKNA